MGTISIMATCDWCEEKRVFESAEEFEEEWWIVLPPGGDVDEEEDIERIYCSRECLVADLS